MYYSILIGNQISYSLLLKRLLVIYDMDVPIYSPFAKEIQINNKIK